MDKENRDHPFQIPIITSLSGVEPLKKSLIGLSDGQEENGGEGRNISNAEYMLREVLPHGVLDQHGHAIVGTLSLCIELEV